MADGEPGGARPASTRTTVDAASVAGERANTVGAGQAALLRAGIDPALERLRQVPGVHRDVAPYRVPWYLVAGAPGSAEALLRAAHDAAERAGPAGLAEPGGWGWWLLPKLVGIALSDGIIAAREDDSASWAAVETALALLIERRKRLPLNGFLATVSVETLAQPAEARACAAQLRRLVAEAYKALRIEFPITIVVTGLDRLPGHGGFFAALPARVGGQALGHLHQPFGALSDPEAVVGGAFAAIVEHLEAVRLGLLLDLVARQDRPAIFRFIEALAGLESGIAAFGKALLASDAYSIAPRWRGLFLTAPESSTPTTRHVVDLFDRFLPQDAGLLTPR